MALDEIKSMGANKRQLEISVDSAEFEKGIDAAYKKTARRYTVPGFRKGKAPRSFVERRYGKGIFYEDAINILCPKALDEAVKSSGLDVVKDKIDFSLKKIDESGFVFTAVVTVKPEVELSGYKGIKIKPFEGKVTEESINSRIEEILEKNSKLVEVTGRECRELDTVVIDFVGKVNGKPFSGGTVNNYTVKLGSKTTIDGFEKGILGHKTGDVFDITVTFPEWYQEKKLRGKDVVFTITLHEIKEPKKPELTNDFVKEISKKETVEDLKKQVEEDLEKELKAEKEEDKNMQIIEKVVSLVNVDIPEAMYVQRESENLNILRNDYLAKRVTLEDVLDFTKESKETKKTKSRELAEQQVKLSLALEAIVRQENIVPTKEEIEKKYEEIANISKFKVDEMKKRVEEKVMIHDVSCLKAFEFLKENSVEEGSKQSPSTKM